MGDSEVTGQVINEDGSFSEGWMESLPEDLREDATLKALPDFSSMAKMLVSGQKMIGADKIVIPGAEATDEDWGAVFNKLGKPETTEGYELAKPEDFPEDMEWSDELVGAFKDIAHKANLLPAQAAALFGWYNSVSSEAHTNTTKATQEAYDGAVVELKKEWGVSYDKNVELAHAAIRAFAGEDDVKALDAGLGNDPRLIKLFSKIGGAISEDKLKGVNQATSPTEVQGEINKILGDPTHPYHVKKDPGHAAAVASMQELYKKVYPEEVA